MKSFLSYEGLPINSGGAHSLKNKNNKENYIEIRQFLENYASKIYTEEIELSLYESAENKYSFPKVIEAYYDLFDGSVFIGDSKKDSSHE